MKSFIMIGVDIDAVKKALSGLEPEKQNTVLRKAQKATAEQARERLAGKAQDSYTVRNAGFKKAMRIKNMSRAAIISAEGEPIPLKQFKVSRGRHSTKAQVLKHGKLKELKLARGGIYAFVNNIARKGQVRKKSTRKGAAGSAVRHFAVAQREGKERLEIHEKYSNSIPAMLGSSKHVYGLVEPHIAADLQEHLSRFVEQALGGQKGKGSR